MPQKLILRFTENNAEQLSWLKLDVNNQVLSGPRSSTLSEIAENAKGCEVVALVPGQDVLLAQADVPPTSYQRMLKAIPYALEEQLAEDIDNLHFALLKMNKAGTQSVAVVAKSRLQHWLNQLQQASLSVGQFLPDMLALPFSADTWFVVIENNNAMVRINEVEGFVIELENLKEFLTLFLQKTPEKPVAINIHNFNDSLSSAFKETSELSGVPINLTKEKMPLLSYLVPQIIVEKANLLQGEFRAKHKASKAKIAWYSVASIAVLWILTLGVGHVAAYFYLQHQSKIFQQQIEALYKEAFPKATSVVTPRVRIEREIQQIKSGLTDKGVLLLLSKAGPVLQRSTEVTLENVTFQNKQLNVQLQTDNFQTLRQFTNDLSSQGLTVKQTSASTEGKQVKAELSIRNP